MEHRGAAQGTGRSERQAAGTTYLSLIDGVRGIAALAVLVYHYVHFFMPGPTRQKVPGYLELFPGNSVLWPAYEFGNYAVQIFWLISGFVFAHVYYGHASTTRSFVVNRLARLYPLHLLTLLVVAGLQLVALQRFGYTPLYGYFDWPHFVAQLFLAADWVRTGLSFNGPIWSVSVELAIYALFWLSRGLVARFGLPLLAAISLGFYFLDAQWGDETRIFACGTLFFAGCTLCRLRETRVGKGLPFLALIAILVVVGVSGTIEWGKWGWRVFGIPGIFGALFLLLAAVEAHAPRWLSNGCEWLGENTYGIYLWHVPIQLALLQLLMPRIAPPQIAQSGWFLALYLALVIVTARVSYVWFERPMRDRVRNRFGRARKLAKPLVPAEAKGGDKRPEGR